jgi:hypothetical protein
MRGPQGEFVAILYRDGFTAVAREVGPATGRFNQTPALSNTRIRSAISLE